MIETDFYKRQATFMRQTLPRRVGTLAVNVKRIGSHSDVAASKEGSLYWVIETHHFAEWTLLEAPEELKADLIELLQQLSDWEHNWDSIWSEPSIKAQMQSETKTWSEKLYEILDVIEAEQHFGSYEQGKMPVITGEDARKREISGGK